MDTYNNPRDPQKDEQGSFHALIPGIVLVGIGALFLLGNLHIVHVAEWFAYWPIIMIAIGIVQLLDSDSAARRIVGGVMAAAGGLLLADNLGYLNFRIEDLWPLILIGIGVMMLWQRTTGHSFIPWDRYHRSRRQWGGFGARYSGGINEAAVFGGSRRVVTDQDFQGGRISCVFGGISLDLTGAAMTGNQAILEIATVYGGATIRIPTSWNLEVRGAGIFGGFVDHTVHPQPTPDMKRLILRGAAVFGGVTIKN